MTRSLIASVGFRHRAFTGADKRADTSRASWAGDWPRSCCCERMVAMQDILRTRGLAWAWRYACVQEVNFGNGLVAVLATARSGHDLGDIRSGGNIWSTYYVCMNAGAGTWARMGDCVQCCWAGLLHCQGTTLCRGGGALDIRGTTVCAGASNRVGKTMNSCVHLCTQGALSRTGFRQHRRRDRRALLSMWGTRTSEGTGGPEHKFLKTGKCVGSGGVCGKQRVMQL